MASPDEQDDNNASINLSGAANSQPLQISQGGLLPPSRPLAPDSQPSFQQQNQHNLMQQQLQRTPTMMLPSNPLSHLNAMGQNSNMQQLDHMLSKASPLQLQVLQQQQQQPTKIMMGLGNVGMGGSAGNNMVGLQGMGEMGGLSPPMTGGISGMGNNMGQNPINMNQASNISNVISQQLRQGMITPAQAAIMTTKLRMAQSRNMLGGAAGQAGNITGLPGSNVYMNQQQPQMHVQQQQHQVPQPQQEQQHQVPQQQQQQQEQHHQVPQQQQQQQQESTSLLQAVLSPPQQVGSPSMGLQQQQQASPSANEPANPNEPPQNEFR